MKLFPTRLQARTSVAVALAFFLLLSLFFFTSYLSIRRSLLARSDGEVRAELTQVAEALHPGLIQPQVAAILQAHHAIGESALRFVVLERSHGVFLTMDTIPARLRNPAVLAKIESQLGTAFSYSTAGTNLRIVSLASGEFIVAAAYNTISLEEAERSVVEVFSYYLLAGLIVGIVGGIFLSRYLIGPIGALAESARNLVGRKPSREMDRLPVSTTIEEVGALAESINSLLDARDRALEHERNFAADAAHELRTPLTVLKGEIEVELRTTDPSSTHAELLRSNLEEIERLIGTVQDLLELAEVEAHSKHVTRGEACSLQTAIEYAATRLRPLAEARSVTMLLPEHTIAIGVSEERLTRVFYNLLLNAIQHSRRGGTIEVRIQNTNAGALVEIEDQGEGIPTADIAQLFERFQKDSRSHMHGGSGLGLAIAKSITDHYELRLGLRRNGHGGVTASIEIPNSAVVR